MHTCPYDNKTLKDVQDIFEHFKFYHYEKIKNALVMGVDKKCPICVRGETVNFFGTDKNFSLYYCVECGKVLKKEF